MWPGWQFKHKTKQVSFKQAAEQVEWCCVYDSEYMTGRLFQIYGATLQSLHVLDSSTLWPFHAQESPTLQSLHAQDSSTLETLHVRRSQTVQLVHVYDHWRIHKFTSWSQSCKLWLWEPIRGCRAFPQNLLKNRQPLQASSITLYARTIWIAIVWWYPHNRQRSWTKLNWSVQFSSVATLMCFELANSAIKPQVVARRRRFLQFYNWRPPSQYSSVAVADFCI